MISFPLKDSLINQVVFDATRWAEVGGGPGGITPELSWAKHHSGPGQSI